MIYESSLARACALGIVRVAPPTEAGIRKRLDFLEGSISDGRVPDATGREVNEAKKKSGLYLRPDGTEPADLYSKSVYETIPGPPELAGLMADLGTAVSDVREILDAGQQEKARERLDGIEILVDHMCWYVAQGTKLRDAGRQGERRDRAA